MYSKKERDKAAWALSVMASSHESLGNVRLTLADILDPISKEIALAMSAFMTVPMKVRGQLIPWYEQWAEAESWVRCGWEP